MKNPRQTSSSAGTSKTDAESQTTSRTADLDQDDASRANRTGASSQRDHDQQQSGSYIETNADYSRNTQGGGSSAQFEADFSNRGIGDQSGNFGYHADFNDNQSGQRQQSQQGSYASQNQGSQYGQSRQGQQSQGQYQRQQGQNLRGQNQQNFSAIQGQSRQATDSIQAMNEVWTNWLFGQVQNTAQAFIDLTECRTPSNFANIQRQFLRANLQNVSNAACRMTELTTNFANSNIEQTDSYIQQSGRRAGQAGQRG
jgi:hypothetical protein